LAERGRGCVDIDGSAGDIGEKRVKDHVVFAVEEENFTVGGAELGAESFCKFYGGESSTDNDNADWFHFFAPIQAPTTNESLSWYLKSKGLWT